MGGGGGPSPGAATVPGAERTSPTTATSSSLTNVSLLNLHSLEQRDKSEILGHASVKGKSCLFQYLNSGQLHIKALGNCVIGNCVIDVTMGIFLIY